MQMLDASFVEQLEQDEQPIGTPGWRLACPLRRQPSARRPQAAAAASPVFNYPYARTREALERLRRAEGWDPCHGIKMRYTNPITGNHAMATMGTFIQLLPKGFTTASYRSTDATVFVADRGAWAHAYRR